MELVVQAVVLRVYASLVIQIVLLALMEQFQDVYTGDVYVKILVKVVVA